jgi:hypothetical protein
MSNLTTDDALPLPEGSVEWVLFLLLASCLWLVFLAGLSWLSGFRKFLRVFTRRPRIKGTTYHLVSLWCGAGSWTVLYPFCFKVSVGEEGLYIAPYFFIRPFHRPMRIGWHSVIDCEERAIGRKFRFVELPISLTIIGRAGRIAHEKLREYAGRT